MSPFSAAEREAVVLAVAIEAVNEMVNHEMMQLPALGGPDATASFKSLASASLFTVRLADALEFVDQALLDLKGSLLDAIALISWSPILGSAEQAVPLRRAIEDLQSWLETEVHVEVWFPSLNENARLKLRRRDFVTICGNISKHNLTRLTGKARRLRDLLDSNDIVVNEDDALGALDDFYEKFQTDVISYHSTTLAELLNNLRWAIHEYLSPEFERSYIPPKRVGELAYDFRVPPTITTKFAINRYWDIMNSVRGKPWVPRFTGTRHLKGKF